MSFKRFLRVTPIFISDWITCFIPFYLVAVACGELMCVDAYCAMMNQLPYTFLRFDKFQALIPKVPLLMQSIAFCEILCFIVTLILSPLMFPYFKYRGEYLEDLL